MPEQGEFSESFLLPASIIADQARQHSFLRIIFKAARLARATNCPAPGQVFFNDLPLRDTILHFPQRLLELFEQIEQQ